MIPEILRRPATSGLIAKLVRSRGFPGGQDDDVRVLEPCTVVDRCQPFEEILSPSSELKIQTSLNGAKASVGS